MNCPSRNDDNGRPGWNQNPPTFTSDLTTREDLNGIANSREQRDHNSSGDSPVEKANVVNLQSQAQPEEGGNIGIEKTRPSENTLSTASRKTGSSPRPSAHTMWQNISHFRRETVRVLVRYAHFVGPGFLISVAYIDPGNYATDVAAGADTRFGLLFVVLMSNLFAIFLQSLCIKLGSVTGLNLAENCRAHLPKWLTIILYLFSEAAIIATDVAEVSLLSGVLHMIVY